MAATYKLVESVGSKLIPVANYDDSHIHHPSRNAKGLKTGQDKDFEQGRDHARIDGEHEEVRYFNGETFVKKDMIFLENGSGNTEVPSPAKGYVYFDKVDGQANIYDAAKPDGILIARVFHLKPETFSGKSGDPIEYGQPLGTQGQTGKNGKPDPENYGIHAHVEFNVKYLDQLKQYIVDVNSGVIAPGKYPAKTPDMHHNGSQLEPVKQSSLEVPDNFKSLYASADKQVRDLYAQAGIDFADGGQNTVGKVLYEAAKANLTEVEQMTVKNGQIHLAQKAPSGFGYTTASFGAVEAANTDYSKSMDGLAALNHSQQLASLSPERNPTRDETVKARSIT